MTRCGNPIERREAAIKMAEDKGGKFLSETYIGVDYKYEWSCSAGHRWEATFWSVVTRGSWCSLCNGSSVDPKVGLEKAHGLAKAKNGQYLSGEYCGTHVPVKWQCEYEHAWDATLHNVAAGKWCPWCAGNRVDAQSRLEDARAYAVIQGGDLLSESYAGNMTMMRWRCKEQHEWNASFNVVVTRKSWCAYCVGTKRDAIEQLAKAQAAAEKKGGECLEIVYLNNNSKMRWRCDRGHEWDAAFYTVVDAGSWCKICSTGLRERLTRRIFEELCGVPFPSDFPQWLRNPETRRLLELDGYNEDLKVAFEYQGEQHFRVVNHFKMTKKKLDTQIYRDSIKSDLCRLNGVRLFVIPPDVPIERLPEWISDELSLHSDLATRIKPWSEVTTMEWTPSEGWQISDLKAVALYQGGDCISESYLGSREKHVWKCSDDHTWLSSWDSVRRGTWCPHCCGNIVDKDAIFESAHQRAKSLGGKCLNSEYTRGKDKLSWECEKGHQWVQGRWDRFNNLKSWCPIC